MIDESALINAHLHASSSYKQHLGHHLALLCTAHFGIALLCQKISHRASSMNYMQQSFSSLMMDRVLASSAGAHATTHLQGKRAAETLKLSQKLQAGLTCDMQLAIKGVS